MNSAAFSRLAAATSTGPVLFQPLVQQFRLAVHAILQAGDDQSFGASAEERYLDLQLPVDHTLGGTAARRELHDAAALEALGVTKAVMA